MTHKNATSLFLIQVVTVICSASLAYVILARIEGTEFAGVVSKDLVRFVGVSLSAIAVLIFMHICVKWLYQKWQAHLRKKYASDKDPL